jgi:cAMP phosphodiesterase
MPGATPPESEALEQLVGEGKKFKTVRTWLRLTLMLTHIDELKTDLQSTREFIAEELKKLAEQRQAPPVPRIEETGSNNPLLWLLLMVRLKT